MPMKGRSVPQDYGCSRTGSASNALNAVQSARIRSVNAFSFKYGRIEIRAQLPKGDWLWPAIWLLPEHNAYGEWPASVECHVLCVVHMFVCWHWYGLKGRD